MRDQKSIENQSVHLSLNEKGNTTRTYEHVIPESICFDKYAGWILNCWDVTKKKERYIPLKKLKNWKGIK